MPELTNHVKSTSVDLSKPEGNSERVKKVYYTVDEWNALQAEREAARIPDQRNRRNAELKREVRAVIDSAGDSYTRMKYLARWTELSIKGSLSPEEERELDALNNILEWARAVLAEYEAVKAQINAAAEAGSPIEPDEVRSPVWPSLTT